LNPSSRPYGLFTGDYLYYTRDMFLIYKSGHLARLTCKPNG
jgi:hypothetical protein